MNTTEKPRITLTMLGQSGCWGCLWAGRHNGRLVGYFYSNHAPIIFAREAA